MKKKILLILMMFLFVTNVKALTFNVDVTNIEDKGSGSLGTITKIDIPNKEVDALFEDIGAEVKFSVTVTNTGNKAGTLRSIDVTGTNDKMEYTTDLPEGGLSINGNDINVVTITAKVKEGAVNGKTSSEIKIKYNYDEGSCPEGEILSEDESMCLCPTGKVRTDKGICEEPPKPVECKDDEVYNTTTKQCEKKVVPVVPDNPKTLDNIILVTLLFIVSGLGIYAVMFKRLKTNKQRVIIGIATGVLALGLSFTVLAGVFGIDNLLGAIVNPITKSKEIKLVVNEEIDLIETWDGECSLDVSELTPENIFQGGSGTESDPYKIKTAEQLSCFAKSINNGTTYQDQYVKQIKDIKLNDHLSSQVTSGDLSNAHIWIPGGYYIKTWSPPTEDFKSFNGTYNGNNHIISGLYMPDDGLDYGTKGLFGYTNGAVINNLNINDSYIVSRNDQNTSILVGRATGTITLNNINTYGKIEGIGYTHYIGGMIGYSNCTTNNVTDSNNYVDFSSETDQIGSAGGIIGYLEAGNTNLTRTTNSGNFNAAHLYQQGGLIGYATGVDTIILTDCNNKGNFHSTSYANHVGGLVGSFYGNSLQIVGTDIHNIQSYNSGNMICDDQKNSNFGGLVGNNSNGRITIRNTFNSGEFSMGGYNGGFIGNTTGLFDITNCFNTGDANLNAKVNNVGGFIGSINVEWANPIPESTISYSYNTGNITSTFAFQNTNSSFGGFIGAGDSDTHITISNSYNRGNITTHNNGSGGIAGFVGGFGDADIVNSYNSGDITLTDSPPVYYMGGFYGLSGGDISYSYNIGNIYTDGYYEPHITGTGPQMRNIDHVINAGSIYVDYSETTPSTAIASGVIGGLATNGNSSLTNSYNLGKVSFDSRFTEFPSTYIGDVIGSYQNMGSNNYFTSIDRYAVGGTRTGSITPEQEALTNTRLSCTDFDEENINPNKSYSCVKSGTSEAVNIPTILELINRDDAFELKDGDSLPTLKVFN